MREHFFESQIVAQTLVRITLLSYYTPLTAGISFCTQVLGETWKKEKEQITERKCLTKKMAEKYEIYTIFKYIFTYVTIWIFC